MEQEYVPNIDEIIDFLDDLEAESPYFLKKLAEKCVRTDAGGQEIKVLISVFELMNVAEPEFLFTFLTAALRTGNLTTVFSLHLLCTFSDRIFQDHNELLHSVEFWSIVQEGLTHTCSLTRKRALFLMKRFTDTKLPVPDGAPVSALFAGRSNRDWEEYFLILETLEEKQVHIVKQVLNKVLNLSRFSPSWIFIVFRRFFCHQNLIVVRWGLENFLEFQGLNCTEFQGPLENMLKHDLPMVLNESKLFFKENDVFMGQTICDKVIRYINNTIQTLPADQTNIINSLVQGICNVSWGPLPLFWVSSVLPMLQCGKVLSESSVGLLMDLVEHHMVYQEPVLRGASQHNLLIFILSKVECISKSILETCLFTFWRNKIFFVNTPCWNFLQDFMNVRYKNDLNELNLETLQELVSIKARITEPLKIVSNAVKKSLLPLLISASTDAATLKAVIDQLNTSLFDNTVSNRPYAADRFNLDLEQAERLQFIFIKSVMDILRGPVRRKGKDFLKYCEVDNQSITFDQLKCIWIETHLKSKVTSVLHFLKESSDVQSIELSKLYIEVLFQVLDKPEIFPEALQSHKSAISNAINIKIALAVAQHYPNKILSEPMQSLIRNLPMTLNFDAYVSNREGQKECGRFVWEFCQDQLQLLKLDLLSRAVCPERKAELLSYAGDSLECGGGDCAIAAIEIVKLLDVPAGNFLERSWRAVLDLRKNEMFWPALEAYLSLLMANLKHLPREATAILEDISKESYVAPGIMGAMVSALSCLQREDPLCFVDKDKVSDALLHILVRCIGFGPTFRRDQRIVTETNCIISEEKSKLGVNLVEGSDHNLCQSVRIQALDLAICILSQTNQVENVLGKIFRSYAELQTEVSKGRQRHFENSEIHKLKNRMMQALMIILRFVGSRGDLGKEYKVQLLQIFLDQLLDHNDQTSVRYLIEWTVVILMVTFSESKDGVSDELEDMLWQWLKKAGKDKIGAVPSFITIITHLACLGTCKDQTTFLEKAIIDISPWSMAQQFGVRFVAQMAFQKLWQAAQKTPVLVEKYQVLNNCLSKSIKLSEKSAKNFLDDFYLCVFDPIKHLTLEDIFIYFPTLCGLSEEEIVPVENLSLLRHSFFSSLNSSRSSTLKDCSRTKFVNKDPLQVDNSKENIQRKITPWKSMNMETELEEAQRFSKNKTREYEDLIVIASLIDRLPNLGGLCRTCEIFGVGKMTVPSLAMVKEKEFTGVSVTAEHWIPLEEVGEANLPSYLKELKEAGWTIIAIEQASKSVSLNNFKFPPKCAILLGKEREGVPVELLNLVDNCIEIPQHGLIRSFNVHVTGAMVLWEYVRQQLM